jgi:acyl-CoA oxidase
MDPNRRIEVLSRHLCSASIKSAEDQANSSIQAPGLLDADSLQQICPKQLAGILIHDNEELRNAVYELLKDDLFQPNYYQSMMEFRELTLQRLQRFVNTDFCGRRFD